MECIKTANLKKNYGKEQALRGVNLSVNPGEIFGFIGPNGAGKTTTIRVLLGLLRSDGGEASVFGMNPWRDAVEIHKRLVYVPGDVTLWPGLSGGEVIDYLGCLQGGIDPRQRKRFVEMFELDTRKKCRNYSKGNRQKVALISAFAANAELLILDEPTSGLDPLMEQVFKDCALEAKRGGKTIFLSSHILEEVEALCDRVAIIRKGGIVESGSLAELRHLARTTVTVQLANPGDISATIGMHDLMRDGGKLRFSVDSADMERVMAALAPMGISSLNAVPPTLEELFLRHYSEDLRREVI